MKNSWRWFSMIFVVSFLLSCKQAPVLGLWMVEEVIVNEENVTPVARWMKFNPDYTQSSGNGWKQHSVGRWNYTPGDSSLTISNENGYKDPYEPFKVTFDTGKMLWEREEDGSLVKITLVPATHLPKADSDALMGVWQLQQVKENDRDISSRYPTGEKNYLFIRWDNAFVKQIGTGDRETGIYRTHGHRPQIEMVYNDAECTREYWVYEVNNNIMQLSATANDTTTVKRYGRIDYFPE